MRKKTVKRQRTRRPTFVIMSKESTMKKPVLIQDPSTHPILVSVTEDTKKALRYKTRKGPHNFLRRHPELKKKFRYIKIAA